MIEDPNSLPEPECPDTPLFYPAVLPIALWCKNAQNRYLGLLPDMEGYYQMIEDNFSKLANQDC